MKCLAEAMKMEQCKAEPCRFQNIVDEQVSLMVGLRVDDITESGDTSD